MTDTELIADFMPTRLVDGNTILEVVTVAWDGPYTPYLRWHTFHTWRDTPEPTEIAAGQEKVLTDPKYFLCCDRCGERCNIGHMHDDQTCQGCAERHLGVVH